MIVHFDKDKRDDLVFTISVGENNHIEIIIDQQRRGRPARNREDA